MSVPLNALPSQRVPPRFARDAEPSLDALAVVS